MSSHALGKIADNRRLADVVSKEVSNLYSALAVKNLERAWCASTVKIKNVSADF